jgi:hypothetical protein
MDVRLFGNWRAGAKPLLKAFLGVLCAELSCNPRGICVNSYKNRSIFVMSSLIQGIAATLALTMVCISFAQGIQAKEPVPSKPRVALVIGAPGVSEAEVTSALKSHLAHSACESAIKAGAQPIYMHARGLNANGEKISQHTSSLAECASLATEPSRSL